MHNTEIKGFSPSTVRTAGAPNDLPGVYRVVGRSAPDTPYGFAPDSQIQPMKTGEWSDAIITTCCVNQIYAWSSLCGFMSASKVVSMSMNSGSMSIVEQRQYYPNSYSPLHQIAEVLPNTRRVENANQNVL